MNLVLRRSSPSRTRRWLVPSVLSALVAGAALAMWPAVNAAGAQTTQIQLGPGQFGRWSQGEERGRRWPGLRRDEREPCDLSICAYQAGSMLVIIARGSNPTSGYATCLERAAFEGQFRVTLRNRVPDPRGCPLQAVTPFEVVGSLQVRGYVRSVGVVVAGRLRNVPVVQAPELTRG